jgi:uncharacterized protein YjbJ (UPF0337 family)
MNIFMRKHTRTSGKKNPAQAKDTVVDNNFLTPPENPRIQAHSMPIYKVRARTSPLHESQQSNREILTSQKQPNQQQQGMPGINEIQGKWKQQVGSAKIAWSRLTEDELLESEGQAQKLAGLIQERYGIAYDEANKQVKKFLSRHTR